MSFVHLFQNPLWKSELSETHNEETLLVKFNQINNEDGHAVIRKRKIKYSPFYYLRVTFGPVINFNNIPLLEETLSGLKRIAGEHKALYIEFNPYSWEMNLESFDQILKINGFEKAPDYVYKNSILIDLNLSEDEIFKQFERRGQKAIRQSIDRGIEVKPEQISPENFDTLYSLYKNTCSRTKFIPEDYSILKKQILYWGNQNKVYLFFAYSEKKVAGALLLFNNGDSISTVYQGNDYDPEIINKRPSNAMYWESLKWAKKNGFKFYDFGGVTVSESNTDEKKEGIHNFKTQFGGKLISLPGNYQYIHRSFINSIINKLIPFYSKVALYRAKLKAFGRN